MRQITFEDRKRHAPAADAASNWQESFYLGWADVRAGIAGAHHISLAPKGSSHVWSWLLHEGKVIARSQAHDLPLPHDDLENMRFGSLHFVAGETLRDLSMKATFADAAVDVTFRAVCDPVELSFNHGETILAERHYEVAGMVSGRARIGGRDIDINAGGWHDHSWGARKFSTNPSHRWLFAVFGDDLACSVFSFVTGTHRASFGWVFDRGALLRVQHVQFHAAVNDDGMTPEGCDAEILTEGNRGYRILGSCRAHALMGGKGWFGVDGLTRFECGGRIGQGFLEVAELKTMTPAMAAELGV